jgi:hypothetical protein
MEKPKKFSPYSQKRPYTGPPQTNIAGDPLPDVWYTDWEQQIEFTEKWPGFYMWKLQHGDEWEKDLAQTKVANCYANNGLMRELKNYTDPENGKTSMQIMTETHVQFTKEGKPSHMNNILALLGDTTFTSLGPYLDGTKGGPMTKEEQAYHDATEAAIREQFGPQMMDAPAPKIEMMDDEA